MAETDRAAPRDPRKDPKKGDLVSNGGRSREVSDVVCDGLGNIRIHWVSSMTKWGSTYLYAWRKWARNAEVKHAAD